MPIDIDNHRAELGLPPRPPRSLPRGWLLAASAFVLFAAIGAGWFVGSEVRTWRVRTFLQLAGGIAVHDDPAALRAHLSKLEARQSSLQHSIAAQLALARAYSYAARFAPSQRPYYEAARLALQQAETSVAAGGVAPSDVLRRATGIGSPDVPIEDAVRYALATQEALVYMELGQDAKASAALKRAAEAMHAMPPDFRAPLQVEQDNNRAYFFATAGDPAFHDAPRALRLAQRVLAYDRPLPDGRFTSTNAAYLDTVAAAYYATGDTAQALKIQRNALARAETVGMSVYLQHYETYARASVSAARSNPSTTSKPASQRSNAAGGR